MRKSARRGRSSARRTTARRSPSGPRTRSRSSTGSARISSWRSTSASISTRRPRRARLGRDDAEMVGTLQARARAEERHKPPVWHRAGPFQRRVARLQRAPHGRDRPAGYAIGGLSVGEPEPLMIAMLEAAIGPLPEDKPRYAMGIGLPLNLIDMVARGVDMFDCVVPNAQRAQRPRLHVRGRPFAEAGAVRRRRVAARSGLSVQACRNYSRAYLRHFIPATKS